MNDSELKLCKKKGCTNPVLDGRYCEYCKKSRKEKKDKIFKAGGAVLGIVLIGLAGISDNPSKKKD